MTVVEYEITSGGLHSAFWLLMPYPLLVKVGQFVLLKPEYEEQLLRNYTRNVTKIGEPDVPKLRSSWFEVNDVQTTIPFASTNSGVESVASNTSMADKSIKKRKKAFKKELA